ncbi:MAG: hypothetical protein U1F76_00660 [Candidatus Competibacteraceae bacterium]
MYQDSNTMPSGDSQFQGWNHRDNRALIERAQAYLDAGLGTSEGRELILGLLLANAQLREAALLAEQITRSVIKGGRETCRTG